MHKIGKELDDVLRLQAFLGNGRDNDRSGIPVPRDSSRPAPFHALPETKRRRKKGKAVTARIKRDSDSGELIGE